MFHVYLLTDDNGSWPLLSFHELPWEGLRTPPLTLLPLGSFDLLDEALRCAAGFGTAARDGAIEEGLEVHGLTIRKGPMPSGHRGAAAPTQQT